MQASSCPSREGIILCLRREIKVPYADMGFVAVDSGLEAKDVLCRLMQGRSSGWTRGEQQKWEGTASRKGMDDRKHGCWVEIEI